jgi:hypothetical protein
MVAEMPVVTSEQVSRAIRSSVSRATSALRDHA